jgi:radical SAM protein with 4Fe4S-binding SPASM domain
MISEDLSLEESKQAVDMILKKTKELHKNGFPAEVLTVDNHCDGPYLYMKLLKENPKRAAEVFELLSMNQGNSSGIRIGCVSWDGSVHADQFWRHYSFGNVRERPFSEIWNDRVDELMIGLKDRKLLIKTHGDRCARCKWFDICNGNLRVRAEAVYGDVWADDPACYLTKEEIGYYKG